MVRLLLVFGFLIACGDDQEEVVDDCDKIVKAFNESPACKVAEPWNSQACMTHAARIDKIYEKEYEAMTGDEKLACTKKIERLVEQTTKTSQKTTVEQLAEERPVEPETLVEREVYSCTTVNDKLLPDAPRSCDGLYSGRMTQEEWDEIRRQAQEDAEEEAETEAEEEEEAETDSTAPTLTYDQPIERGLRALTNPDIPTVIVEHEDWREGTARVGCRRRSDGQVFYVLDQFHDKGVALYLSLRLVLGTGCAAGYDLVR